MNRPTPLSRVDIWKFTVKIWYQISSNLTRCNMVCGKIYTQNTTWKMPTFGRQHHPMSIPIWRSDRDIPTGMSWRSSISCARICTRVSLGIEEHGRSNRDHHIQLQCVESIVDCPALWGDDHQILKMTFFGNNVKQSRRSHLFGGRAFDWNWLNYSIRRRQQSHFEMVWLFH